MGSTIGTSALEKSIRNGEDVKSIRIDNQEWVRQNFSQLNPNDPDFTFKYVTTHHPLGGCPSLDFQNPDPSWTWQQHAELADAVTITCFEYLGTHQSVDLNQLQKDANSTTIANLAYIALHHSNPLIRQKNLRLLNSWKGASPPLTPHS